MNKIIEVEPKKVHLHKHVLTNTIDYDDLDNTGRQIGLTILHCWNTCKLK